MYRIESHFHISSVVQPIASSLHGLGYSDSPRELLLDNTPFFRWLIPLCNK